MTRVFAGVLVVCSENEQRQQLWMRYYFRFADHPGVTDAVSGRLNQEKRTFQIDCERTVECSLVALFERSRIHDTCINQQDIDPPNAWRTVSATSLLSSRGTCIGSDHQNVRSKFLACRLQIGRIFTRDGNAGTFTQNCRAVSRPRPVVPPVMRARCL